MKNLSLITFNTTAYFFILLFFYASISKILDFENFQVQIGQSPLLSAYAGIISYSVIIIELLIVVCLCFPSSRLLGLYASTALMSAFTVYIYLILNYSDFVPCSCGGILEKLGWKEHLIFNAVCVVAGISAVLWSQSEKRLRIRSAGILTGSCITAVGAVILLFISSEYIIKKENNFTRRFLQHPIVEQQRLDLHYNSYYFAGSSTDSIYLGNYTTPFILTAADLNLRILRDQKLILDKYNFDFKRVQLSVEYPFYYLYDGSVPVIYNGFSGHHYLGTESMKQAYFTQLINIDKNSFVLSTFYVPLKKQALGILSSKKTYPLNLKSDLLKSKTDGVFDTDGQLHYDRDNEKVVYVHYYKNQFLVTDKKLEKEENFTTIDTITNPHMEVARLSDGKRKMKHPPLKVNITSTVKYGLLFNQSNLMGKFETAKNWNNNAVIDVYSILQKKYIGSFYIPKPKNINKIQMEIVNDNLFVLVGNEMVRYRFAQNISEHFIKGKAENPDQE